MDPISLFMIAILGMLIYFMIRNSRKQRKTQEELQEKLKPGADVMTSFGLYARLLELDDENNIATLDVGKGVLIKVHRQTVTKVVEDEPTEVEASTEEASDKSS
ncbi:MAG TPA: preprotein translocase subunit YajC [Pontimonas sp.]|nr:preprotein translocase subunit YajC [Pontimonas sp.]